MSSSFTPQSYTPTDASSSGKGVVQLTGDLAGTAASPALAGVTTAGTVGSASLIPVITYDAKGRITATSTAAVAASGSGTVTSASVVSANGLAGTVATATTTPAISLTTTVTGIVKGNGTALLPAVAGTDYALPNASTTGTAANITGIAAIANGGTGSATQNFVDLTNAQTINGVKSFGTNIILANATTGLVTASGTELVMQETGDAFGQINFRLQNRTGANGAIIENTGLDLIDLILKTNSGTSSTFRFEHRSGNFVNTGNTGGEFQIGPNGVGNTILYIGATASGIRAGKFVTPSLQVTTTPTAGYVLTADASGNATWQAAPGGSAGITRNVSTITTAVTAGSTASVDYTVFINTGGTLTMPTAVGNTNRYSLKNISATNTTVGSTSAQTFDGGTLTLSPNSSVELISDGTNWKIF